MSLETGIKDLPRLQKLGQELLTFPEDEHRNVQFPNEVHERQQDVEFVPQEKALLDLFVFG